MHPGDLHLWARWKKMYSLSQQSSSTCFLIAVCQASLFPLSSNGVFASFFPDSKSPERHLLPAYVSRVSAGTQVKLGTQLSICRMDTIAAMLVCPLRLGNEATLRTSTEQRKPLGSEVLCEYIFLPCAQPCQGPQCLRPMQMTKPSTDQCEQILAAAASSSWVLTD